VRFAKLDLKSAAFSAAALPAEAVFFNQASPSAYVRGNTRSVPLALAVLEGLASQGARVINGADAFRLELSKSAQVCLMRSLGVSHPETWVFNDPAALLEYAGQLPFPAILKPNQGGSGARMFRVGSFQELDSLLKADPSLWFPDNLLLLQEYLEHDFSGRGVVRMEFLGGELLYALRVVSNGNFNLCPSDICHPSGKSGSNSDAPRFFYFPEVPKDAVEVGRQLVNSAGIEVGAVEYLETPDGRQVFYDINANSNLRRSLAPQLGFDPFERVVDYLVEQIDINQTGH
jgi:hypothetical protein